MTRLFAPLLCLLLLGAPALAPPAEASDPPRPPMGRVWTVLTTVEAEVVANYATVRVIADIGNRGPDPEFPFRVRIPDDAFVTGLTIERDGVLYEAEVKGREEARREYEAHKAQEQTGGLVEKDRRSSVYSYLINVAEFTSVRAVLTYERYLTADRGVHNLTLEAPVSGFGQDLGARFDVTIRDPLGVVAAWSQPATTPQDASGGPAGEPAPGAPGHRAVRLTHAVGPRPNDAATPFLVSYTLPGTGEAGALYASARGANGSFAHVFRAPPDARVMPLDLVLVLDVSGSMQGEKLAQMKDAAVQVVRTLKDQDRLHLVFFSSGASAPWDGLRAMDPAGRRAAADEVDALLVAGGTNLEAAIRGGFAGLRGVDWAREEGRMPLVVILTDGQPTEGITQREELRRIAREANARGVNLFTIAFGHDADWPFLHALAREGDGTALRVPQGAGAEVDLRRFLTALTTPALKDVRVRYGAGVQAYGTGAPVLFAGSDLLVVGTYDATRGPPRGNVTARAPDGLRAYPTPEPQEGGAWVGRLAAYHEIRRLQELIGVEGARAEWVERVTALGLQHGFVTDYTSLVVTLEPRAAPGAPTPAPGDARALTVADASGSPATGAPMRSAPTATPAAPTSQPPPGTPGPAGGDRRDDAQAFRSRDAPAPEVPGPGAALVAAAIALAALALASRRRR